jgi:hypothetical protein
MGYRISGKVRVSIPKRACYSCRAIIYFFFKEISMEWTTPKHEEIDLNCEISSYANAEL